MTVVAAVERDLARLGRREKSIPKLTLAAVCLELAAQLDDPGNSATSKSMCAKSLQEALARLEELAGPAERKDRLDELARRRSRRRSAA